LAESGGDADPLCRWAIRRAGYVDGDLSGGKAAAGGGAGGLPDAQVGADLLQGGVHSLVVPLWRDVERSCQRGRRKDEGEEDGGSSHRILRCRCR
jgi:hypothetical protein